MKLIILFATLLISGPSLAGEIIDESSCLSAKTDVVNCSYDNWEFNGEILKTACAKSIENFIGQYFDNNCGAYAYTGGLMRDAGPEEIDVNEAVQRLVAEGKNRRILEQKASDTNLSPQELRQGRIDKAFQDLRL